MFYDHGLQKSFKDADSPLKSEEKPLAGTNELH